MENTLIRAAKLITLGFFCGAAFGVFFGAVASLFQGGPALINGIVESWWWFALVGTFIGLGLFLNERADQKKIATFAQRLISYPS
jgi:hypothetical protein